MYTPSYLNLKELCLGIIIIIFLHYGKNVLKL